MCLCYLGLGHITSQYLTKRAMIARVDGVETTSKIEDDQTLPLKDCYYDDVEYSVKVKSLVARCALNALFKEDDIEQQMENILHTKCHINNKGMQYDYL